MSRRPTLPVRRTAAPGAADSWPSVAKALIDACKTGPGEAWRIYGLVISFGVVAIIAALAFGAVWLVVRT